MGYYDNYLEHGAKGWTKKNHKYIRRENANGKYRYIYSIDKKGNATMDRHNPFGEDYSYDEDKMYKVKNTDSYGVYDDGYVDLYTKGKNKEDAIKKAYDHTMDNYRFAKKIGFDDVAKMDLKDSSNIAKDLRKEKEKSPKARLGKAILSITNSKNLLKKKIKDLF